MHLISNNIAMKHEKKKYTAVALWRMHTHDIRSYAREAGVRSPTSKNKGVLVEEILKIQNGEQEPCQNESRRGRPILK